jgi:hypothetical protein
LLSWSSAPTSRLAAAELFKFISFKTSLAAPTEPSPDLVFSTADSGLDGSEAVLILRAPAGFFEKGSFPGEISHELCFLSFDYDDRWPRDLLPRSEALEPVLGRRGTSAFLEFYGYRPDLLSGDFLLR